MRAKYPWIQYEEKHFDWAEQLLSRNRDVPALTKNRDEIVAQWHHLSAEVRWKVALALCKLRTMEPRAEVHALDKAIAEQCIVEGWLGEDLWYVLTRGLPLEPSLVQMVFCKTPKIGKYRAPPQSYHRALLMQSTFLEKKKGRNAIIVLTLKPGQPRDTRLIRFDEEHEGEEETKDPEKGKKRDHVLGWSQVELLTGSDKNQ